MKDFAESFYKSKQWQRCRAAYVKSVGGLCEDCLKHGVYNPGIIVHHKTHIDRLTIENPEVTLSFANLELLCRDCHAKEHAEKKRYGFDSDGNIIPF